MSCNKERLPGDDMVRLEPQPGDVVAVVGAGPIGLAAMLTAQLG